MENGQEASVLISAAGAHQDGAFTLKNAEELQVCLKSPPQSILVFCCVQMRQTWDEILERYALEWHC